jgi:hypothetical protein
VRAGSLAKAGQLSVGRRRLALTAHREGSDELPFDRPELPLPG